MEVDRYSMVLFITALLAQLYAIRWLLEIALAELGKNPRAALDSVIRA